MFNTIQSIGTIVAILFAVWQIRKSRIMSERDQATGISCWISSGISEKNQTLRNVEILNSSKQPIYNVAVSIDCIHYNDNEADRINEKCTYISIVPPGHYYVLAKHEGGGMCMQFSASISFTDASGKYWYRDAWGKLTQKKHDAFVERKIALPVTSESIKKISDL